MLRESFSGALVEQVGFNPPFHSIRGPLDRSGPCGVKQATFSTHEERGPIILVMLYAGQSKTEGVVTGWKSNRRMQIQWKTSE